MLIHAHSEKATSFNKANMLTYCQIEQLIGIHQLTIKTKILFRQCS